jgi:hypothetical protein
VNAFVLSWKLPKPNIYVGTTVPWAASPERGSWSKVERVALLKNVALQHIGVADTIGVEARLSGALTAALMHYALMTCQAAFDTYGQALEPRFSQSGTCGSLTPLSPGWVKTLCQVQPVTSRRWSTPS